MKRAARLQPERPVEQKGAQPMFNADSTRPLTWTTSDGDGGIQSTTIATLDTEHMGDQWSVFAEQIFDLDGVTSMVALGRVTAAGSLTEPIEMSLDQCDELIAALVSARNVAAGIR